MTQVGVAPAVSPATVRRWVREVLAGEAALDAVMSVTFLSAARMRRLNRAAFGRDATTDVIAYPLRHVGRIGGDVYVSPTTVRRNARRLGVPWSEEIRRVVVHGVLHALGYEHPEGPNRARCSMWRRQERYVRALGGRAVP